MWIQSVWVSKTMPWRKHNMLTRSHTAGIYVLQHLQEQSCIFIFHETLIFCVCRRSVPWFLTEEVEVLVDPSTWVNLNKGEPGTNDRDYLSSLIVLQSYVRILLFVHHLVCNGHLRTPNVPPYSTVSLGWMQGYVDNYFCIKPAVAVHSICYI